MIKHQISLRGPATKGKRISALLLKKLLEVVTEGAKGALRLRVEGRSTARGSEPAWLVKAADFEITGLSPGSTVIEIEAPTLFEAVPDKFAQQNIFSSVETETSAFAAFEKSFQDAIEGKEDSDLFDEALLQDFLKLGDLFDAGIEQLEFSNGSAKKPPLLVMPKHLEEVKKLKRQTPPSQAVRIAGKINTIRESDKMFELVVPSGTVKGIAPNNFNSDDLREFFGKDVTLVGKVVFRPSGSVLRVETTKIELAHGDVSLWNKLPSPRRHTVNARDLRRPQTLETGLNAVFGKWPGDETDEQLEEALK